jgi:hypothetical protein
MCSTLSTTRIKSLTQTFDINVEDDQLGKLIFFHLKRNIFLPVENIESINIARLLMKLLMELYIAETHVTRAIIRKGDRKKKKATKRPSFNDGKTDDETVHLHSIECSESLKLNNSSSSIHNSSTQQTIPRNSMTVLHNSTPGISNALYTSTEQALDAALKPAGLLSKSTSVSNQSTRNGLITTQHSILASSVDDNNETGKSGFKAFSDKIKKQSKVKSSIVSYEAAAAAVASSYSGLIDDTISNDRK